MSQPEKKLDPRVADALASLKNIPPRDPQAAARGRAQFLSEAESLRQAVSKPAFPRHKVHKQKPNLFRRRKEKFSMIPLLTSILVAFTLLAGGAGATAYAAQDALPGEALFPVKTWIEDVQLALADEDTSSALQLETQFTQRRMDEMATLIVGGQFDALPEAVAQFENQLGQFGDLMESVASHDPEQARMVAGQMDQALAQHTQMLSILIASSPEQARSAMQHALQVVQRVQLTLQEQFMGRQSGEQRPEEMPTDMAPNEHPGGPDDGQQGEGMDGNNGNGMQGEGMGDENGGLNGMPGNNSNGGRMTQISPPPENLATPMPGNGSGNGNGMQMTPSNTPVPMQHSPGGGSMETQMPGSDGDTGGHNGGDPGESDGGSGGHNGGGNGGNPGGGGGMGGNH